MTRSELRENVFRILFRYEFHDNEEFNTQLDLFFEQYPEESDDREDGEHWPKLSDGDIETISARVGEVLSHLAEVDAKLSDAMVGWKLERVGKAELSILRIASYEILFDDQIELPVAINEAVNLSKKYCDEKAHAFVNGVLAKLS